MSHKKWRETKQQLIWFPNVVLLGCCLVSHHFHYNILRTPKANKKLSNVMELPCIYLTSIRLLIACGVHPLLAPLSLKGADLITGYGSDPCHLSEARWTLPSLQDRNFRAWIQSCAKLLPLGSQLNLPNCPESFSWSFFTVLQANVHSNLPES